MPHPHILCALSGAALLTSAVAAPITWQPAEDTVNPAAILADGTSVEAINASSGGTATVNGVTFTPSDTLLSSNATSNMLQGAQTLDPGLDDLLDTLDFGGGTATSITVGGGSLVVGQSYSIQVFFTDLRSSTSGRVMTYGDGLGGDVDVAAAGAAGSFGQNAIGTFVADGTSQTLSLATNGFGNAHINAYQIRSAFPLPVITSFDASPALIASGASSTLSWQISGADSAQIDTGIGAVDETTGSTSVSPAATTTYTLTASNGGGSVSAEVTVGVDVPLLGPVLNEFLASNDNGLLDNNDENSDWIEIYNPNAFEIDLGGYYLTDVAGAANWSFPAGTLLAGEGYLVVFASGVSSQTAPYHTDFKISSDPGYLALVAPDGSTVVDEFVTYPDQRTDFSYSDAGYHTPPTPGEANGAPFSGFVADTNFDIDRGFYDAPFTVTITSDTPDAIIVYTTDGSDPTLTNGTQGSSVAISGTTVLRAAAFKVGLAPTNTDTQTYLFLDDVIEQAQMDPDVVDDPAYSDEIIPALKSVRSLSIVTHDDNLFDNSIGIFQNTGGRGIGWEREVSIEFLDPDDPSASFQTGAGLRIHGNGSRGNPKNSLRLLFRADYGAKKLNYPLFGEDFVAQQFNTVVLRAQNANSWTSNRSLDRQSTTFLQDTFAKDTQAAMGQPHSGSTFVHLYLNGTYWGMYNPTERPDGSFGEDHFGGDDTDYDAVSRRFDVEVQSGTKDHWDEMIAFTANELDTQAEYDTLVTDYIDIENLIDYMLVHQFMQTRDGPDDFGHNNMRLVRRNNPAGLWQAYAWDMEYSMIDTTGTRDYDYPYPIYSSSRNSNNDITDSIASIYIQAKDNNPEFQLHYADRAYKHLFNGGALTPENATDRFELRAEEIESALVAESARWGDQRRTAPYTRDGEWTTELNRILNEFFPARPDHVISQLRIVGLYPSIDPPAYAVHGGSVPAGFNLGVTAGTGTVYYTTDGSDPRLTGGAANPSATSFASGTNTIGLIDLEENGWAYLDTGTAQSDSDVVSGTAGYGPADWKHPDFDDSTWATGQAMLGYGLINDRTINTLIGPNSSPRHPTTYFRKEFNVTNAASFTELEIDAIYDDGVILYLNGHEIARSENMGSGNVQYVDFSDGGTPDEGALLPLADYALAPGQLLEGTNVLAVELHQATSGSSDVGVDVILAGIQPIGGVPSITLNDSTVLKARLLNNGEWSALTEATFLVGPLADASNLAISEIFYQPAGASEALEFIELQNISAASIELSGVQFSDGIDFTFTGNTQLAPGGRILLVRDLAAFEAEYGAGLPIAGEFLNSTGLSNSGERLELLAADGSTIRDFVYDDDLPWPTAADGLGHSLVLINPGTNPDHALPSSWRSSVAVGGTPGTTDSVAFTGIDPTGFTLATDGTFITLGYTRPIGADDVTIAPQWSEDLVTWTPLGDAFVLTAIAPVGGGQEQISFESLPTILDAPERFFLRLVVEPVIID